MFTWLEIFSELSKWILPYRNRQAELCKILKDIGFEGNLVDEDQNGKKPLEVIDPFTFFAFFQKIKNADNRNAYLKKLKEEIGLLSEIPSDFYGLPSAQPMALWYFSYERDRTPGLIDTLWDFAEQAVAGELQGGTFKTVLAMPGIRIGKLSQGLFWLNPNKFYPIDAHKGYLEINGINTFVETLEDYLNILKSVQEKFNKPYYEISYDAWKYSQEKHGRFWRIGTHDDSGNSYWEEMKNGNFVAIGWSDLGDLGENGDITKEEIIQKFSEAGYNKPKNVTSRKAGEIFNFVQEIEPGDIVLAAEGMNVLGVGIVKGNYHFDEAIGFPHLRDVEWQNIKGQVPSLSEGLRTTVFEVKDPSFQNAIKKLISNLNTMNIKEEFIDWFISRGDMPYKSAFPSKEKLSAELDAYQEHFERNLFEVSADNYEDLIEYIDKVRMQDPAFTTYSASPRMGNGRPRAVLGHLMKFIHLKFVKENMQADEEKKSNIEAMPLNTILYGPPGTGKTFHSIDYAVKIATGESNGHKANKEVFDSLRKEKQIEFVTFHQNYSYEDFMVGIRPAVEEDTLKFSKHKGIFYELVQNAKENYQASLLEEGIRISVTDLVNNLLERLRGGEKIALKTSSGVDFSIKYLSEYSIQLVYANGSENNTLSVDTLIDVADDKREYTSSLKTYYYPLKNYLLKDQIKVSDQRTARKNYVLIIDEINRANISKVFGELITLLEDDKRSGEDNELKITLPNGEKDFGIPPNLYIVGTMNTADKSIALIDIALRRRFEFIGKYPEYDHLLSDQKELLQKINTSIFDKKKSADYLIGHAYFMKGLAIENVLRNKVIPLLMEYFSGKTDIVSSVFEGTAWAVKYNTTNYIWEITKR